MPLSRVGGTGDDGLGLGSIFIVSRSNGLCLCVGVRSLDLLPAGVEGRLKF